MRTRCHRRRTRCSPRCWTRRPTQSRKQPLRACSRARIARWMPGEAPFVAAALQVYWVKMALQLGDERRFSRDARYGMCPVCGSHPVASVVRIGGAAAGAALPGLLAVRVRVARGASQVQRLQLDQGHLLPRHRRRRARPSRRSAATSARPTSRSSTWRRTPASCPVADDLATLALDMLVDQEGYNRIGPNLLFLPGQAQA